MAWYDSAVFYHIYPLGLCGCPHDNNGETGAHFDKLNEWAEHAKRIGCNAIYIGPLFESGSHGYDTTDYRLVDRRLGTNDDFKQFVKNCHANDVKVIVDGVFNHTGRDFFAFQDIKQNRENSRYKDWYCNVNFWGNNEYNDGFSYDNWGGYNLLAKLNLWNPEVKNYHLETVKFWVDEFDIDGIRLDVAYCLNRNFMKRLRYETDQMKQEFFLVGEMLHGDYNTIVGNECLHSATNYECYKGLYSSFNSMNMFEIAHSIERQFGKEPWCLYTGKHLLTFVDNHDVSRIASTLTNKAHLPLIYALMFGMPGIPCIYYGSEWGCEAVKGSGNDNILRPAFDKPEYNELTDTISSLGQMYHNSRALSYGDYTKKVLTNRQYVFKREADGEKVLVAINADENEYTAYFDTECADALNLITGKKEELSGKIVLPPYSFRFYRCM